MDDAGRAEAQKAVQANVDRLCKELEPFYSTKLCPRDFLPCRGPRCMLYMPQAELHPQTGKPVLIGGECAVGVLANQVGQVGGDLAKLLELNTAPGGSHVIR